MKKRRGHSGLQALQGGADRAPEALTGSPVSIEDVLLARKVGREVATEIAQALADALRKEAETAFKFSLQDPWTVQLFVALARKHGLKPYRSHGQKSQTVMVRTTQTMIDTRLWPEFTRLADRLHAALHQATDEIVREATGAV